MALQPDGQIVVAGYTNTNATLDGLNIPVFTGTITGATNASPIVITSPNPVPGTGAVVTISGVLGNTAANGTWTITQIDPNHFSLNGSTGNGIYTSGGTWQTTASFKSWNFVVARLNAQNGLLDASFSGGGIAVLDFFQALFGGRSYGLGDDMANHVIVQPDGKIVVAGRTWMDDNRQVMPNFGIARYTPSGTLDRTLNGTGLIYTDFATDFTDAQDVAYSVAVQGDGKIVVAGSSDRLDAVPPNGVRPVTPTAFALVRYNLDGTEDQTFGLHGQTVTTFTGTSDDKITNILIQPSGQIVVAGSTDQGGGPIFALARYSGLQSGSFQFSQPVYSVNENGGSVTITVTRGGGSQGTVTVNYATSDGTAKAGTDYSASSGTLAFAPGQTTATFTVPVMSDGVYQPTNKVFNLTLSNPTGGAFLGFQSTATVTVVETDQPGSLAFSAASYNVNQNGGSITITVTRTNGSVGPVGVTYVTSNGTAMAGTDYTATTGALSFASGETSKTFTVTILNSGVVGSGTVTFNVSLLTPTGGATLGNPNTAVVNIVQTNVGGTIQFSPATYTVAENGGSITLTVTQTGGANIPTSVTFTTSDGTAVAGTDYTASIGTVTFSPGQMSAVITIGVIDDGVFQTSNKTFNVTLSNPTNGATIGAANTAVVTMTEKDGTPNQLFIAHAYLDILGRPVDPGGLANWTNFLNAGGTRQQVAAGIMNSQEYRSLVVTRLFMLYLHRSPDAGGLATYTAFLANGGIDEQVAAILASSQEYFVARGGGTNSGFLTVLYQDVLNRPIDTSGLASYSQFLANGGTRAQVASILLNSTEYLTNLVQSFYVHYLRRAADPAGLNTYVTALQMPGPSANQSIIASDPLNTGKTFTDETLIAILVGSQEYFNLVTM